MLQLVNLLVHNIQHTYTGQYLLLSVIEYSHLNLVRQKRKSEKKSLKGQSAKSLPRQERRKKKIGQSAGNLLRLEGRRKKKGQSAKRENTNTNIIDPTRSLVNTRDHDQDRYVPPSVWLMVT